VLRAIATSTQRKNDGVYPPLAARVASGLRSGIKPGAPSRVRQAAVNSGLLLKPSFLAL